MYLQTAPRYVQLPYCTRSVPHPPVRAGDEKYTSSQGFIRLGGGGGGISIYEKEGCVMRKRGVGDKSLCQ